MVDNQHKLIKGYRELSEAEIELMNTIKELGNACGILIDMMSTLETVDKRWLAIGSTDLQKGLMSLTRSVAQPTTF